MRHRAALAGAALAVGLVMAAGPSSADSVRILTPADPACCSISDASKLETDPDAAGNGEPVVISGTSGLQSIASVGAEQSESSDPATVQGVPKDGSEKLGDVLDPDATAGKESVGSDDAFGAGESLVPGSDESFLTRVVAILTRLGRMVAPGR
jgi:hypothetical protein